MITPIKSSKLIGKILAPALKLWLKSQTEEIENLQINIIGSDRQILRGDIPQVLLTTDFAIYQGLHLGKIKMTGENIQINLGQVLRGQPLRLLKPIPVTLQVEITAEQLQSSLASTLLSNALTEILFTLLNSSSSSAVSSETSQGQIQWQTLTLHPEKLKLAGTLIQDDRNISPLVLQTGLEQVNAHQLNLAPLQISGIFQEEDVNFREFPIDLGSDVQLKTLTMTEEKILLQGELTVQP